MSKQLTFGKPKLVRKPIRKQPSMSTLFPKKKRGRKSRFDHSNMISILPQKKPEGAKPDWVTRHTRIDWYDRGWCLYCDHGVNACDAGKLTSNFWEPTKIWCEIDEEVYIIFKSLDLCPNFVGIVAQAGKKGPKKKHVIVFEDEAPIVYVDAAEKL